MSITRFGAAHTHVVRMENLCQQKLTTMLSTFWGNRRIQIWFLDLGKHLQDVDGPSWVIKVSSHHCRSSLTASDWKASFPTEQLPLSNWWGGVGNSECNSETSCSSEISSFLCLLHAKGLEYGEVKITCFSGFFLPKKKK